MPVAFLTTGRVSFRLSPRPPSTFFRKSLFPMQKSKEPSERREAHVSGETSQDLSVFTRVTRSMAPRVSTGPAEEQTAGSVTIDISQESRGVVRNAAGDNIKKREREDSGEGRQTGECMRFTLSRLYFFGSENKERIYRYTARSQLNIIYMKSDLCLPSILLRSIPETV